MATKDGAKSHVDTSKLDWRDWTRPELTTDFIMNPCGAKRRQMVCEVLRSWRIEHSESTPCTMQHYLIFWCRLLGKQTHSGTQRAAGRLLEGLKHHKSVALWGLFFFFFLVGNGPWRRLSVTLDLIALEASPSPRRPLRPLPTHHFEEIWSGFKKIKK